MSARITNSIRKMFDAPLAPYTPTDLDIPEYTYVVLVKRPGFKWRIETVESSNKSVHLNYLESLRGIPDIEEAKVLQFTKIAGFVNENQANKNKGCEPELTKIL